MKFVGLLFKQLFNRKFSRRYMGLKMARYSGYSRFPTQMWKMAGNCEVDEAWFFNWYAKWTFHQASLFVVLNWMHPKGYKRILELWTKSLDRSESETAWKGCRYTRGGGVLSSHWVEVKIEGNADFYIGLLLLPSPLAWVAKALV